MVSKTVLIEVLFMWRPEEPVRTLAGNRLERECACKLLKGVPVLSLEIGELQAARLENCYSFANKDKMSHYLWSTRQFDCIKCSN